MEIKCSEFIVRLPAFLPSATLIKAGASTTSISSGPRSLRKVRRPLKILFVDDNETAVGALAKMFELRGHSVSLAYTGGDAITRAQAFEPDVVILDIGLPDMDGYEVARNLQKMQNKHHIVALTGYGQAEDKERAKQAGFYYHLTKPAGLKEIETVLRRISRERYARSR